MATCQRMSEFDRDRWLFSRETLMNSPSREDNVSWDMEKSYRRITCLFIVELGNLLQSGQSKVSARGAVAVSAACMLFHRFYVFQSFKKHNRFIIAATCLFLAMKIEECPRNIDSIIKCYCSARRLKNPSQEVLKELRESILVAERIVLYTLCFDFQLEHPIGLCVLKVKADLKSFIPDDRKVELVNTALNFLRDSNGTLLSLLFSAHKIALGALFMATLQLGISPVVPRAGLTTQPRSQSTELSWFDLIKKDIDEDSLKDICNQIIEVYELQQKSSSSQSSKWADVDVASVRGQVDRLQSSPEEGGYGYDAKPNDVKNTETVQDYGKQDCKRKNSDNTIRKSNSVKIGSECDGSDEEEKEVKGLEEEQWEGPPTSRQPMVRVSVIGHGHERTVDTNGSSSGGYGSAAAVSSRTGVPPTPEFLPPPTPDFLPPPTPEYLPPPPSSLTTEERTLQPQPTPDFLPPPDSPAHAATYPACGVGGSESCSSRGKVKFSPALHLGSDAGSGSGRGLYGVDAMEDVERLNGMRHSLVDPWCLTADSVSPKRARLR